MIGANAISLFFSVAVATRVGLESGREHVKFLKNPREAGWLTIRIEDRDASETASSSTMGERQGVWAPRIRQQDRAGRWAQGFGADPQPGAFAHYTSRPCESRAIPKDLPRTFSEHPLFASLHGEGVGQLQMLLFALHAHRLQLRDEHGYCQGYNYIAAHLLLAHRETLILSRTVNPPLTPTEIAMVQVTAHTQQRVASVEFGREDVETVFWTTY